MSVLTQDVIDDSGALKVSSSRYMNTQYMTNLKKW